MLEIFPTLLKSGIILSWDQDTVLLGWGKFRQAKEWNELEHKGPVFYCSDFFFTEKKPWRQYQYWQEIKTLDLVKQLKQGDQNENILSEWINPHYFLFKETFDSLKSEFSRTLLQKAVPYAFCYSSNKMTTHRLLNSLKKGIDYIKSYSSCLYGFWDSFEGILGVTPEVLFNYDQQSIETIALAGTSSLENCRNDFMNDSKELEEHQLVIEGLTSSLNKFGEVKKGDLQILELPTLKHLLTSVRVHSSFPFQFEELVHSLHPTPALGTFPKEIGKKWLKSYQKKLDRGFYGAPIGCYDPQKKKGRCVVAIRNVQWNEQGMKIGAGCGIVKESVCEQEWKEINLKMLATQQLMGL